MSIGHYGILSEDAFSVISTLQVEIIQKSVDFLDKKIEKMEAFPVGILG